MHARFHAHLTLLAEAATDAEADAESDAEADARPATANCRVVDHGRHASSGACTSTLHEVLASAQLCKTAKSC